MKKKQKKWMISMICMACLNMFCGPASAVPEYKLTSPDKQISVKVWVSENQEVFYNVSRANTYVLLDSKLGIVMKDANFTKNLKLASASKIETVKDRYEMVYGKRKVNTYQANRQTFAFTNAQGQKMEIIFQVSNDGVAFRYYFPGQGTDLKQVTEEISSFRFGPKAKAWLQPMAPSKSGWCETNPSYEEYYEAGIETGKTSPTKAGWVFPALFETNGNWVLITETGMDGKYCGCRLRTESPEGEYTIGFPQEKESFPNGALNPESVLPWYTPWRVMAIGSLKTITESTLETDLAEPARKYIDKSAVVPGLASWSWVLMKDDATVYDVQKKFIDYAHDMNWKYCLIDADWDKKIGYEKIKELADYAKTKNISLILWYNSAGSWNSVQYTPKDKLITHEARVAEFTRLKEMGIKGLKIDFFGGDGQSMIKYYMDILEDAAKFGFATNFHGCTYPRSWHRTYPNLVNMESIKGMEFITFEQKNANEAPTHCNIIPYTRNAFSPMDFTPMCLYKIPNIERKTSACFELALPVLFIAGIQHMAEIPEGMATVPGYVKEFLQNIPAAWDDTRFIDGYPGKLTVIARKAGNAWFVAGINGEQAEKTLELDLSFIPGKTGVLITDGNETNSFQKQEIKRLPGKKTTVTVKAAGGFVMKF